MDIIEYKINSVFGTMHLGSGFSIKKHSCCACTKNEINGSAFSDTFDFGALEYLKKRNIFLADDSQIDELERMLAGIIEEYKNDYFEIKFFIYQKNDFIVVKRTDMQKSDFREERYIRINIVNGFYFEYKDVYLSENVNQMKFELVQFIENYIMNLKLEVIGLKDELVNLICMPGTGGHMIHELLGHMLEADIATKKMNFLMGKYRIGDKLADERLSVLDDISVIDKRLIGLNTIDDEGEALRKVNLIKKGVLNSWLCDSKTSEGYNFSSMGCARRQNYYDYNLPRMRATYIKPGSQIISDLYKNSHKAVLLQNVIAGNVNPVNGSFILIGSGKVVKNEKVVGKCNKLVISGNIIDTINAIEDIGSDFSCFRINCNKYGQSLSVGVGSPTIKFGKIKVSGE